MCGLFLFTLVCGRHGRKRGWEISNFLGFLGNFGVGRAGAKNFRFFGKFELGGRFFDFFGFQKGCRSLLILFEM